MFHFSVTNMPKMGKQRRSLINSFIYYSYFQKVPLLVTNDACTSCVPLKALFSSPVNLLNPILSWYIRELYRSLEYKGNSLDVSSQKVSPKLQARTFELLLFIFIVTSKQSYMLQYVFLSHNLSHNISQCTVIEVHQVGFGL